MRGRIGTSLNGQIIRVRRGPPTLKELIAKDDRINAERKRKAARKAARAARKAAREAERDARARDTWHSVKGTVEFGPFLPPNRRTEIMERLEKRRENAVSKQTRTANPRLVRQTPSPPEICRDPEIIRAGLRPKR